MPELLFHGAAGEVTGSMHMVQVDGRWLALDCGLFQGHRREAEEKNRRWPMPAQQIDAVVLSHAHTDHAGRLPKLVRDGFDGPIYCTPATRDLCAYMLPDSAHIQEEDAHYTNKKRARKGEPPIEPLYGTEDAVRCLKLMRTIPNNQPFNPLPGVTCSFNEAGHILGSAGVLVKFAKTGKLGDALYFSGDVGRFNQPIIHDPAAFPQADTVILESTYGGKQHADGETALKQLFDVIDRTIRRGGKVVVPAFSVGRTQAIVYYLQEWFDAGRIPCIPVYVDSPLAIHATHVFRAHPELYDHQARNLQKRTGEFLRNQCVEYIHDVADSKALNDRREPCVIISASGMCEAGRIRHHIKNNISNPNNTLLLPGYQGEGTLGRRLADGATEIRIFEEDRKVRAEVVQLSGFSAHADESELLRLMDPLRGRTKHVHLVHGEADAQTKLLAALTQKSFKASIAKPGERVAL